MIATKLVLLLALGATLGWAEEVKRNIDMEAAEADGLSLEDFDALELEARESEGEGEQNPDLFEGDIVPSARSRNANVKKNLWRGRTVPYYFDSGVSSTSRSKIKNALSVLMRKVNANGNCLNIRPSVRSDSNYIHVINGGGCYSSVGCTFRGRQDLSLGRGCLSTGTIQHEFMHALGFWHEQSRSDRDRYVTILWDNITDKNKHNFKAYQTLNQGFGYDYGSVMHYGAYAFSKNRRPTIQTKGGNYRIGQRNGVSDQDVQEIRRLYGC